MSKTSLPMVENKAALTDKVTFRCRRDVKEVLEKGMVDIAEVCRRALDQAAKKLKGDT